MKSSVLATLFVGGVVLLSGCATRLPREGAPDASLPLATTSVAVPEAAEPLSSTDAVLCSAPVDEPPAPPAPPASEEPAVPAAPPAAPETPPAVAPPTPAPDAVPAPAPPVDVAPIPVRPAPVIQTPSTGAYAPGPIVMYPMNSSAGGACAPCAPRCAPTPVYEPCCAPEGSIGLGLAVGPDIGASINGTYVIRRASYGTWSAEVRATGLFLDNTEFHHRVNTGDPGSWYQVQAGLKLAFSPQDRTHLVGRFGLAVIDAGANVDLLTEPGTYFGGYVGLGFETRLSPRLTMGPDLTFMAVAGDGSDSGLHLVPQLGWTLSYMIGGCVPCGATQSCNEHRDLYVGIVATAGPGVGGGFTLGQVFARTCAATWSFELQANKQNIDGVFGGDDYRTAYSHVLAGAKVSFSPERRIHFVTRGGFTAFKSTGTNDFLDKATTYYGAYAGIGLDWDIARRLTTGPEATVLFGTEGGGGETAVIPQLSWHLTFWL